MELADLDLSKMYTYADYLKWQFETRVELIKGKIFEMSAPNRLHQKISAYIQGNLFMYLRGKGCDVYAAPFDVRFARKSNNDSDVLTVVQPDLCVICDPSILDERGAIGAPDVIVEILSPSNNKKELKYKYDLYEETGVKEYWIVYPVYETVEVHVLRNGVFCPSRPFVAGDVVTSSVLDGFTLNLTELFEH